MFSDTDYRRIIGILLFCFASHCWALAVPESHTPQPEAPEQALPQPTESHSCEKRISINCGSAPSVLWHSDKLWVVFAQGEHVYLVHSQNKGRHFSEPVQVTRSPETVETNGENRPKIAATDKALLVSWTQKTDGRYTGDIRFSRSLDEGESFEAPRTINDDGLLTSHRFESLLTIGNLIYLAWLDKRDKERAATSDTLYHGSAVYMAVSDDHGATFSANTRVAHHSCECCRIALAPAENDHLALFWRHIFNGNTRDHGFARVTPTGEIAAMGRATEDQWQIDACPHHGPDMAVASRPKTYHLAWFSDGKRHSGIYYGLHDSARGITRTITAMDTSPSASHPQVVEHNGRIYFAWKRFDGEQMHILLAVSNDGGNSWSEPRSVAATASASDHPALIVVDTGVYLAWHTQAEGFLFEPVDPAIPAADIEEQQTL